jgi:hypothetical protein
MENAWHSDVTWREQPSLGSILRAIELPEVGGDTLFSNMVMAYEDLDEDLKARLCEMTAVHDIARVFAKRLGKDTASLHEKFPLMEHPVVRTHPETGQRLIYVNTAFTGIPVPVPLGTGLHRLLGQSRLPALCRERLFSQYPHHGTRHDCRRPTLFGCQRMTSIGSQPVRRRPLCFHG